VSIVNIQRSLISNWNERVFKAGTQFAKDPVFYNHPILEGSFYNLLETKSAKPHKDMYQPFFSRSAIQKVEVSIQKQLDKFLARLEEAAEKSKVIDLTLGFKCLIADVVMQFCYQKNFGALDAPDFQFDPIVDLEDVFDSATFVWYFPRFFNKLSRFLRKLPRSFVRKAVKPLAAAYDIQDVRGTMKSHLIHQLMVY
jgi:Cytochrome P450